MFDSAVAVQCADSIKQTASNLDLIKTITSVIAVPLAFGTFSLGYWQKERERTRSYYHKVVTDVVLQEILTFFGQQIDVMTASGRDAIKGLKSAKKAMPRSCTVALASFATGLFSLQDRVLERTLIFDEKISAKLLVDFESIQDDVANWFNDASLHKRRDIEAITRFLQKGQRTIIKRLYKGKFRDF